MRWEAFNAPITERSAARNDVPAVVAAFDAAAGATLDEIVQWALVTAPRGHA